MSPLCQGPPSLFGQKNPYFMAWSGLILDLGGGLQLTRVRDGQILSAVSLPLGLVWTSARFLQHDPPPSELVSLRREVDVQLTDVLTPAQEHEELIGLGGTARSLCRMNKAASSLRRRKRLSCQNKFFPLQRSVITTFLEQLGKIPADKRVCHGLKAERADTIVAGMVTIEEIMLRSGFPSLTVLPQGGVRHGILMRETFDKGKT